MTCRCIALTVYLLNTATLHAGGPPPKLAQQLVQEKAEVLAREARAQGDASRGALIFHRADLGCFRCHTTGEKSASTGARPGADRQRHLGRASRRVGSVAVEGHQEGV